MGIEEELAESTPDAYIQSMSHAFFLTLATTSEADQLGRALDPFAPPPSGAEELRQERESLLEARRSATARCHSVDQQIRSRLGGSFGIDFLDGIDAWTVRTGKQVGANALRRLLAGVPVTIAENTEFEAH